MQVKRTVDTFEGAADLVHAQVKQARDAGVVESQVRIEHRVAANGVRVGTPAHNRATRVMSVDVSMQLPDLSVLVAGELVLSVSYKRGTPCN